MPRVVLFHQANMTDSKNIVLSVNNIEVIYDHVILVLKGVSLDVPEGGIVALLGGGVNVCIGTDSECADQAAAAREKVDPGAFDMLITFELGSDRLSEQARENLREFAKALNGEALRNATFSIDGHTDARGSRSYNNELSIRRADAVVHFLEGLGIDRSRLRAAGFSVVEFLCLTAPS